MKVKFEKLAKKIEEIIDQSEIEVDPSHSKQVHQFVLQIEPNASEELQIAALAHDIERGVAPRARIQEGENYDDYKRRHAKRSAEITADLMQDLGYSKEKIEKVSELIKVHEEGGSTESDILRDADSISYFANNIDFYLDLYGEATTAKKISFMYDRASDRAKKKIKQLEYSSKAKELMTSVIE